jgi:hypothetical protein
MPACTVCLFITTEELYGIYETARTCPEAEALPVAGGGSCISPPPFLSTIVACSVLAVANRSSASAARYNGQRNLCAAICSQLLAFYLFLRLQSLSRSHFQPSCRIQFTHLSPLPHLDHIMASRQRGPKPSESLIDPAYYHKCDYQTSNSSSFADPQVVYSKTYKEKVVPELQQDLRSRPLLTSTSYVGNVTRNMRL